jgi:hypothetical protein
MGMKKGGFIALSSSGDSGASALFMLACSKSRCRAEARHAEQPQKPPCTQVNHGLPRCFRPGDCEASGAPLSGMVIAKCVSHGFSTMLSRRPIQCYLHRRASINKALDVSFGLGIDGREASHMTAPFYPEEAEEKAMEYAQIAPFG